MLLRFTKMHELGNDFVVLDLLTQRFQLKPGHIRRLADRRLGVGCDHVLAVAPPDCADADFQYRLYSADGSEDRKSTRLNSSHVAISYAAFCLKKKNITTQ